MPHHVLLIEDDERIREIVERGLGARGFAVTSAADAPSGVQLGCDLDVDLVLLDLVLPGGDGLTVLESLRRMKPRLPVIALTALADMRCKVDGLEAGATTTSRSRFRSRSSQPGSAPASAGSRTATRSSSRGP